MKRKKLHDEQTLEQNSKEKKSKNSTSEDKKVDSSHNQELKIFDEKQPIIEANFFQHSERKGDIIAQDAGLQHIENSGKSIIELILESGTPDVISTLIWLAGQLATTGRPDLLKTLLLLPDKIFTYLNWNICPQPAGDISHGISLAWMATDLAFQSPELLEKFLLLSRESLAGINWNTSPTNPKHKYYGVSLAWMMLELLFMGKYTIVKLLKQLPNINLTGIDWNSQPKNPKHKYHGASLAWMMVRAAKRYYNSELKITNLVEQLPNDVLATLDWNSHPKNKKRKYYGATLAWITADSAWSSEDSGFNLLKKFTELRKEILTTVNWDSHPKNFKHDYRGASLVWLATQLNSSERPAPKNPLLLDMLMTLPNELWSTFNWNSYPFHSHSKNLSIAWRAANAVHDEDVRLLGKLIELPNDILAKLDWNESLSPESPSLAWLATSFALGISNYLDFYRPICTELLDKLLGLPDEIFTTLNWNSQDSSHRSLAWIAVELAIMGDRRLLNELIRLPDAILLKLNWKDRPNIHSAGASMAWSATLLAYEYKHPVLLDRLTQFPRDFFAKLDWHNSLPAWHKSKFREVSIIGMATLLAINANQPTLLNILLGLPEILDTIFWRMTVKLPDNEMQKSLANHIFSKMAEEKTDFKYLAVEKLINDNLITRFPSDAFTNNFQQMLNRRCFEWEMAIAELSPETLQKLHSNCEEKQHKNLVEYFDFLIALKRNSSEHPLGSTTFSVAEPVRASTGYLLIARSHTEPSKRIIYFEKIVEDHPFYFEAQFELANLHLFPTQMFAEGIETKEIESKNLRKKRLIKSLSYACRWAHFNKKATLREKQEFLQGIITAMFSLGEEVLALSHSFHLKVRSKIESITQTFTPRLENCNKSEVSLMIEILLAKIETAQKDIEIIKLKHKLEQAKPSAVSLFAKKTKSESGQSAHLSTPQ